MLARMGDPGMNAGVQPTKRSVTDAREGTSRLFWLFEADPVVRPRGDKRLVSCLGTSERRACRALGHRRSSQRYRSRARPEPLRMRLRDLALYSDRGKWRLLICERGKTKSIILPSKDEAE